MGSYDGDCRTPLRRISTAQLLELLIKLDFRIEREVVFR